MEELKTLISLIKDLPALTVWVLGGYLIYKLVIIGSIYKVIALGIERLHSYLIQRKVEYKEIRPMLDGMCIQGETDRLIAQLHRLRGVGGRTNRQYIHGSNIDWLRDAIDDKIAKEQRKTRAVDE